MPIQRVVVAAVATDPYPADDNDADENPDDENPGENPDEGGCDVFGIGMSEMLIICAVALLVFGPTELPQIAKKIARGLKEVRKASDDLRKSIDFDDDEPPRRPPPPPLRRDDRDDRELPPSITGSVLTADTLAHAAADTNDVVVPVSAASSDTDGMPVLRSARPLAVSKHFNDDDDVGNEPVTEAVVTTTTEPSRG